MIKHIIIILSLFFYQKIYAIELSGFPSITDGDTIKISNKRIRFHGVDTPEKKQICIKNNQAYSCGKESTDALAKKINEYSSQTGLIANVTSDFKKIIILN